MHFYGRDGSSQHTIIGKNGKERTTSIKDARELGLVPSVTTIMDVQAKPALMVWLQNQITEAAWQCIKSGHPTDEVDYKRHLINTSKQIGEKAAKRGNEIHDAMEGYFKDTNSETNVVKELDYIEPAIRLIHEAFPYYTWYPEQSFCHESGFGGRIDLWGTDNNGNYVIIDFKTKDKTDLKDFVQYDEHRIQLAAYQLGLRLPTNTRRFNLFISVNEKTPGLCKLVECTEFSRYLGWFSALHRVWVIKNKYDPGEVA